MEDLFQTLTLSNVSGDVVGSAIDILASWSGSSNWSDSQQNDEEQDIVPFLEPDNNPSSDSTKAKASSRPASRSTSSSNQTVVMMTNESAMTGSSSFGKGANRHELQATWCSPPSADSLLTKQRVAFAQEHLNPADAGIASQSDAASDFSRSGSSNLSNDEAHPAASARAGRFHLSELIGRGAFGSVYKGSWKGTPAAIKAVEHDDGLLGEGDELDIFTTDIVARHQLDTASSSMNGNTAIMMEAALSSAVMHPNVVQTYHYETCPSRTSGGKETYVVMEWCEKGSLQSAVADGVFHVHGSEWGHDAIMPIISATLLDISTGMAYLHRMHILHCDLKLRNVLLKLAQDDWRGFIAKVSDFGLSRLLPESHMQLEDKLATDDVAGTVTHMAPELLSDSSMSPAADVYAFGILMYELWSGQSAFPGLSKVQAHAGPLLPLLDHRSRQYAVCFVGILTLGVNLQASTTPGFSP
ncbi:hypothetical protein ABBQ32_013755 [Trebouxia sp. C0010 RCD-2024]